MDTIKPDHYKHKDKDLIQEWYERYSLDEFRAIMKSHIEKYIRRYERKNGVEDLEKAGEYIRRLKMIENNVWVISEEEEVPKPGEIVDGWLVEELEVKIQELIESYKQEDGAYSNPENAWIGGFIEGLENLVEEEQKYRVIFPSADESGKGFNYLAKDFYHKELWVEDARTDGLAWEERSSFTEDEIRALNKGDILFEHFAVKVEEMEE